MSVSRDQTINWIKSCAAVLAENRDYLIQLDSAIGDGDHGANMDRGFKKVLEKIPEYADKDIGTIFKSVGMNLISTVGGAGGPLYGTLFMQMGMKSSGKMELTLEDWTAALEAGIVGVIMRGKAELGDKTMVDALKPALEALRGSLNDHESFPAALQASVDAAQRGMLATIPLVARKGRASYLGERSAGHQDPGATSSYLLLKAAADLWSDA